MKKSKAILMVVCAMLLVAASVMGTLAYLTSTDEVVNTFSVGKVKITLDEAKVDDNGKAITGEGAMRVDGNAYHLMPGHTYDKDPQVHVKADSDPSYIRMLVTVSDINKLKAAFPADKYADYYADGIFLLQKLVGGWDNTVWACTSVNDNLYEFRYVATTDGIYTVPADAATEYVNLPELFKTITIPTSVDGTALANLNQVTITVVAQAIQADGFATADAAWTAFASSTSST